MQKKKTSEAGRRLAWEYYDKQRRFKRAQEEYDKCKEEFYDSIGHYFGSERSSMTFEGHGFVDDGSVLAVSKVEKTAIEWFPEKLEKRIPKSIAKQVIHKDYVVRDMKALSRYLKSCGVDPAIFRRYIEVVKTVDQKAVDQLGDLGELAAKDISGCYVVKSAKPYFTVKVKNANGDGKV